MKFEVKFSLKQNVKQPVSDILYDMNKRLSHLIEIHYHMISKINDIQYTIREIHQIYIYIDFFKPNLSCNVFDV